MCFQAHAAKMGLAVPICVERILCRRGVNISCPSLAVEVSNLPDLEFLTH